MDVEEMKAELCTIVITRTGTGVNSRDRWDTPEIVMPNGRKGRMRKDRYSSLVMANMVARSIQRVSTSVRFGPVGGFTHDLVQGNSQNEQLYAAGPDWFTSGMGTGSWMKAINRKE